MKKPLLLINKNDVTKENTAIGKIVAEGAVEMGLDLPSTAVAAFELYHEILTQRGKQFNLTAIIGDEDVARLHFLDSISLVGIMELNGTKMIDIGAGAGFPGIPLKIAAPSIELTLLEATGKRVVFLSELSMALGIDVKCIHARAEEAAFNPDLREMYDIAVSRAVARLNVLCELCLPFVRIGGLFLAMKGCETDAELAEAQSAIITLGAEFQEAIDYSIPGTDIKHRVLVIRKTSQTPEVYPRRFARIQKKTL